MSPKLFFKKMNKNLVKIAVLGAGYMGQNHARVFSSIEHVNLMAICDKDRQKVEKLAKQYKIKPYFDYQKLLQSENIGAVSICLPTSLHYHAAQEAIRMGVNLFIEKPITSKIEEAKKLIKLAKSRKVRIMVGHIERFNPVVNEIKQRVKSGELGKILQIHTQRFSPPTGRAQD